MSNTSVTHGAAIENRAAEVSTSPLSGPASVINPDQGTLLAQIPDLDAKVAIKPPKKRFDGRVISQALSMKLIFGIGIGLVIGAILPYIFGKACRPTTGVKELPAWVNDNDHHGLSNSPAWPAATTAAASTATSGPAILVPEPAAGTYRPAALTEPAWTQPRSAVAAGPAVAAPPPRNDYGPAPAAGGYTPNNRPDDRSVANRVDPGRLQADLRSDAAAIYRNAATQVDNRINSLLAPPVAAGATGGYIPDSRYGNLPAPPSAAAPQGRGPAGASPYPAGAQYDAGVARFDGTIAPPPPRSTFNP